MKAQHSQPGRQSVTNRNGTIGARHGITRPCRTPPRGASGDFYQIHYDKDFALGNNLPGLIIHGALKSAWLGQLVGDWAGEKGAVKSYGCSYRGMDVPDDALICKGVITKKYTEGDEHLVAADIWLENSKGEKTTPGTAVVVLPSKN